MPWYWTDELARVLLADGRVDPEIASRLVTFPVAIRSEESSVEAAADALAEEGEIPLAA